MLHFMRAGYTKNSMELTSEHLAMLERLGRALTSIDDVHSILGPEVTALCTDNPIAHNAYMRGKLMVELEVRESILQQAASGSTPAQALAYDMIKRDRAANV